MGIDRRIRYEPVMPPRHVTIDDVARRSGLSIATVSRVIHNSPRVSPAARQRVQEAIDALGYTPNALARALVTSSTHTVGVLVSSIADPFWGEVVQGIEEHARAHHYAVLIASSGENAERERHAAELFRHKRVDGIVVCASSAGSELLGQQSAIRLPLVFVNNEHFSPCRDARTNDAGAVESLAGSLVSGDDTHGAVLAVEHLLALGHRRIAYIGPPTRASSIRRLAGYRQALQHAGICVEEALVAAVGEGANSGELAAFRLLAREPTPSAFFCYDDMTALGAMRAVRAMNLRVPADRSVVGFDDIPVAAYLDPPLTTVRQPMFQMGQQAMAILLQLLQEGQAPERITMRGELVVRSSTAPPPAAGEAAPPVDGR